MKACGRFGSSVISSSCSLAGSAICSRRSTTEYVGHSIGDASVEMTVLVVMLSWPAVSKRRRPGTTSEYVTRKFSGTSGMYASIAGHTRMTVRIDTNPYAWKHRAYLNVVAGARAGLCASPHMPSRAAQLASAASILTALTLARQPLPPPSQPCTPVQASAQ
eukprot:360045-Chlamydomonas_euryale.AAC.16